MPFGALLEDSKPGFLSARYLPFPIGTFRLAGSRSIGAGSVGSSGHTVLSPHPAIGSKESTGPCRVDKCTEVVVHTTSLMDVPRDQDHSLWTAYEVDQATGDVHGSLVFDAVEFGSGGGHYFFLTGVGGDLDSGS